MAVDANANVRIIAANGRVLMPGLIHAPRQKFSGHYEERHNFQKYAAKVTCRSICGIEFPTCARLHYLIDAIRKISIGEIAACHSFMQKDGCR
jgi:hypothetical protein